MLTRRRFGSCAAITAVGLALGGRGPRADEDPFGRQCAGIEARLRARLGVAVIHAAADRPLSYRGSELFPMASTFKALTCGAVLRRVDLGLEELTRRIRFETSDLVVYSPATQHKVGEAGMTVAELCQAAITLSDNTAANLLLKTIGGPPAITEFARTLGDMTTRLDRWETALNEAKPDDPRDTTTPRGMAHCLQALCLGDALSATSREQLTGWLVANTTGDAKLRSGFPKEWRIGDKTGAGGFGTTNDVAVVWPPGRAPLVVTMFVTQTSAPAAQSNAAFAAVAQLVGTLTSG